MCKLGFKTAGELVAALYAGIEVRESAREAAVDALVVAKLEVQAVVVRVAAPVSAVERVAIFEEERHGDDLAVARRDAKLQTFAELCRHGLHAAQGQIPQNGRPSGRDRLCQ